MPRVKYHVGATIAIKLSYIYCSLSNGSFILFINIEATIILFLHLHGIGKQHCSGVPSSGSEDYTFTASTVQELPGASISSCALFSSVSSITGLVKPFNRTSSG
jgi:hypothetical protein